LIDTIISIIANILSIFGITIDVKKALSKLKNKKFRNISIILLLCICCFLIISLYISNQRSIIVTKVTLNENSLTMNVDDTYTLTATVLYSNNSTDDKVLWSSSNNSIATVDENGVVTALADGSTIITVQASKNNSTEIAECVITVKSPPSGYSISVHQLSEDSYVYVYVTPYDKDITKIKIYGRAPSGEVFTPNKDENDLYHFYSEYGTWTIYASVENDAGIYEAHKPEDFVTIEVTNTIDILGNSLGTLNDMLQQLTP